MSSLNLLTSKFCKWTNASGFPENTFYEKRLNAFFDAKKNPHEKMKCCHKINAMDSDYPKNNHPLPHQKNKTSTNPSFQASVDEIDSKELIKPVVRTLLNKSSFSDDCKVKDYMTQPVVCLHKNMKVKEAAEILLKHGISGAPVVENHENGTSCEGKLIGIISLKDFLWKETISYPQEEDHLYKMPFYWNYICDGPMVKALQTQITKIMSKTIDDLMNTNPVFIDEDASLNEAAEILLNYNIGRLPVLSNNGDSKNENTVVGIITGKDILRHLINFL